MENTDIDTDLDQKTQSSSYAFKILRTTRVRYTTTAATKSEIQIVVFATTEEEALKKAETLSQTLEANNEYYIFDILTIEER